MILPDGELRFGVAPQILIDCARQLAPADPAITLDAFCQALGAPPGEAAPVLVQMIDAGYFVAGPEPDQFKGTQQLRSLAAAHVGGGITRREAEVLLEQVLQKAVAINGSPGQYLYAVKTIVVFGSFLGTAPVLGDLDLGVELQRVSVPAGSCTHEDPRRAWDKTVVALRLRKPKIISVHDMGEVREFGYPFREVFPVRGVMSGAAAQ